MRRRQRPDLCGGANGADPDPGQWDRAPFPFLDISAKLVCCGEQGLLSMAFPPGFASKTFLRELHEDSGRRHGGRPLPRLRRQHERGDPTSEEVVLTIPNRLRTQRRTARLWSRQQSLHRHGRRGGGEIPRETLRTPARSSEAASDRRGVRRDAVRRSGTILSCNPPAFYPRSGRWGCGTRGDSPSTGGRGPLHRDVGQIISRRSTSSRPEPGGQNYGWNIMEGRVVQHSLCDTPG